MVFSKIAEIGLSLNAKKYLVSQPPSVIRFDASL